MYRTVMDVTGDGITDLLFLNHSVTPITNWKVYPGFLNADGSAGGFAATGVDWHIALTDQPRFIRAVNDCTGSNGDRRTTRDTIDITGDGIPDYVIATSTSWKVYRGYLHTAGAQVGGFAAAEIWAAPYPYTRVDAVEVEPVHGDTDTRTLQDLVDLNGDGRPDLVRRPIATGPAPHLWEVSLNTGDGFEAPIPFPAPQRFIAEHGGNLGAHSAGVSAQLADIDGDGVVDFLHLRAPNTPTECRTDVDGDGTFDPTSVCLDVYRGTGRGFEALPRTFPLPDYTHSPPSISFGIRRWEGRETLTDLFDINGDGLPDLVAVDAFDRWYVYLNRGGEFATTGAALRWPSLDGLPIRRTVTGDNDDSYDNIDMIDVDGDGMLDRVVSVNGGTWTTQRNLNPVKPNLLTVIQNGLGGMTTLRYQPSTIYQNTGDDDVEDLPTVMWVVDGIRRGDGLCDPGSVDPFSAQNPCIAQGHELVTEIEYEDGRFDREEREFRGFRLVSQRHRNDPAPANVTQSFFAQTREIKGKLLQMKQWAGDPVSDPNAKLVASEENVWQADPFGTAPGRVQVYLKQVISAQDYSSGTSLANAQVVVRDQSKPDANGNVQRVRTSSGAGADCVLTVTAFATPSGASGVRDKPAHTHLQASAQADTQNPTSCGGGATTFSEKWFSYDGQVSGVSKGSLTTVRTRMNATQTVAVTMAYDAFGNVTHTWDERGHLTQTIFDPYRLHPTEERNAKQHAVLTTTDYRWGKPLAVRDANHQYTCYGYDAAGRPSWVVRPLDSSPDCANAATAPKWETYDYGYADGGPQGRHSWVRMSRREPEQPSGYLTT
ncbi:MAG TPA: toxin TcdB middle/N-terminal domain-containing protein, partial [Mycobacterium sp.]